MASWRLDKSSWQWRVWMEGRLSLLPLCFIGSMSKFLWASGNSPLILRKSSSLNSWVLNEVFCCYLLKMLRGPSRPPDSLMYDLDSGFSSRLFPLFKNSWASYLKLLAWDNWLCALIATWCLCLYFKHWFWGMTNFFNFSSKPLASVWNVWLSRCLS